MTATVTTKPQKFSEVESAKVKFTGKSWDTLQISAHEQILKPKYMVCNIDWRDIDQIKKAKVPFVKVTYSDDIAIKIDAYSGTTREVPVFYAIQDTKLILSDRPKSLTHKSHRFNDLSVQEFLAYGYVTSDRTLLEGIYSLEAGGVLHYEQGKVTVKTDYLYNSLPISDMQYPELFRCLEETTRDIFDDLIKAIKGKSVILPLSAGYDSRFIAAMLKMGGAEDVTCYAWGRPGHKDIETSRAIAEKLGYKWAAVDYSPHNWKVALNSEWLRPVLRESTNYTSISGTGSVPFQGFLREIDIENSIILSGHTGDFIGGGHIPPSLTKNSAIFDIALMVGKKHVFAKQKRNHEEVISELESQLADYTSSTDPYRVFEMWDQRERQCKFIVNTNRYYEELGISWSMPFWDFRFMTFWDQVPLEYKQGCKLYHDFLENSVFSQVGIDFSLKRTNKKNNIKENAKTCLKRIPFVQKLKQIYVSSLHSHHGMQQDEFGFYLSLPYFYEQTRLHYPEGFNCLQEYCDTFDLTEPQKQYEYLARSVLAMLFEE